MDTTLACNLAEGFYSVTVTDNLNCIKEVGPITVASIPGPDLTFDYSSTSCFEDGYINVNIDGPNAPYNFSWSDGAIEEDRINLAHGEYVLSIEDSICPIVETFIIESAIELDIVFTPTQCDSMGGSAEVLQFGGSNNLQIEWSTGSTDQMISNLTPGGYSVTVIDDNGCRRHENVIIPLDSSCFSTISGTVFLDENNTDCIPDSGATGVSNMLVSLGPNISTFTDSVGNYSFNVTPDIYDVELLPNNPIYELLCPGPVNIDASGINTNITDVNLFVEFPPNKDLKIYVNKGVARPGFNQVLNICVFNYGDIPASGNLIFKLDSLQQFLSGVPQDYSYDQSIHTLSWSFDDIPPGGGVKVFTVTMHIDAAVPLGTLLSMNFEANPIIGDVTPENNFKFCTVEVRGCLLYTSPSPRDRQKSRMPSSA